MRWVKWREASCVKGKGKNTVVSFFTHHVSQIMYHEKVPAFAVSTLTFDL